MENLPENLPETYESPFDRLGELDVQKQAFIKAMIETMGNIAQSMMAIKKSRKLYYYWLKTDDLFRAIIEEQDFQEVMLDYAESKLMANISKNDVASIIFFLKTKGKKRGYVEKTVVQIDENMDKAPSWFKQEDVPTNYNPDDFEEAQVIETKALPEAKP